MSSMQHSAEHDQDADGIPYRSGFVHWDDESLRNDPWTGWDLLRNETPVFTTEMPTDIVENAKLWYFLDYERVHGALQRTDLFSNSGTAHPFAQGVDERSMIPGELDPPEHWEFRKQLNQFFSPGRIASMEGAIRATCVGLIEGVQAEGRCDFMTDFARRFPTTVFMRMAGLPLDDLDEMLGWVEAFGKHMGTEEAVAEAIKAEQQVLAYLAQLLREKRSAPADDFLTHVAHLEVDGRPVNAADQLAIAYLFFQAGMDTVASQLGWIFKHLADSTDVRSTIVADPALIPSAVEEWLRCRSILSQTLIVRHDAEFQGCPVNEGDRVVVMMAAANRDPAEFDDAGRYTFNRKPNRHIAFGVGPHRCIGAHLARLELQVAIEEWHARIPDYRVPVSDEALGTKVGWAVTSLSSLPLEWAPA